MKVESHKKTMSFDKKEHEQLAKQLSCPQGDNGITVGESMYQSNQNMILSSIDAVQLEDKNRVLEIGHGNCSHLNDLLKKAHKLRYFGLEISEVMRQEAEQNNLDHVKQGHALFQFYNGSKIPYVFNFFDRIMTVNTIYFWKNPKEFIKDLYRVLRPGGICVISFVNGNFMKKLPFINSDFSLYDSKKIIDLIFCTKFELMTFQTKKEFIKSKTGSMVYSPYTIAVLKKPTMT